MVRSCNDEYRQRLAQAERVIGELNALKVLYYEPTEIDGGVFYVSAKKTIDKVIEEIRNEFC